MERGEAALLLDKEYMNVAEAAAYMGKAQETIRRWIRSGDLKAQRSPGSRGRFRIKPEDLDSVFKAVKPDGTTPEK